jgi:rubrerythrin
VPGYNTNHAFLKISSITRSALVFNFAKKSTIITLFKSKPLQLQHKKLVRLLQQAYSAEKAAAFAYQGHAGSVKDAAEKAAIKQIEIDEWNHRREVLVIMKQHNISISKYFEFRFHVIGKIISFSCYIIGWFMPFYFAGRLESGNVCEYFRMMQYFHELGIVEHNEILYEMGIKEKEHEVYFLSKIKNKKLLPFFEKLFFWGAKKSMNDVDLNKKYPIEESRVYCKK